MRLFTHFLLEPSNTKNPLDILERHSRIIRLRVPLISRRGEFNRLCPAEFADLSFE